MARFSPHLGDIAEEGSCADESEVGVDERSLVDEDTDAPLNAADDDEHAHSPAHSSGSGECKPKIMMI